MSHEIRLTRRSAFAHLVALALRASRVFAVLSEAAILAMSAPASAQDLSPDDLARRTVERRAVEAVVWGMPAVNYDLMYQAMVRETKGDFNQIVYWSPLPDWKNQTLTPNP